MRRRRFLGVLGGALAASSVGALAQQRRLPLIGFLNSGSAAPFKPYVGGLMKGLGENGYIEGRNFEIEYRWAEGIYERLPALAAELVKRPVDLLVATGGEPAGLAAKAATSTIPIVFAAGGDPVKAGLVPSLNRPGGNLTGISQFTYSLDAKRLALLHEMAPGARSIVVLINRSNPNAPGQLADLGEAASRAAVELLVRQIDAEAGFEAVFAEAAEKRLPVFVGADPFFNTRRVQLTALAARARVPAMYEFREFAAAGGLMSYGSNLVDGYRLIGVYASRVLGGARPAELPVLQPTTFELVINLKTAREIGFDVPPTLLARADDVIE